MALFQDYNADGNVVNHTIEPDSFSKLGFDEIVEERRIKREEQAENEKQWVSNLVSPDRIKEWENKGKMTAIEVWQKKNKNELIPYMGTWQEGTETFKIKGISDKLKRGQVVTPEERQLYESFILDMAEIQTRGYTFGGGAMNIGLETVPFMAEFGIGLLTSGGTASVGATSSKITAEALKKTTKQKIAEGLKKTAYNATINPKTYAFTATRLPQQVRARMGDIMLSDSVAITPEGQAILKEGETNPAIAFMKALALTNVEVASEISGAMLVRPVMQGAGQLSKAIASPVLKHLPDGFAEKFVKLAEETTNLPFIKAVDELGFNGVLEEMGEERVGDLLKFALNIDDKEGYSFEQLLDAVFPSMEQLGQEALSFAVTGLGMNALHAGLKSIPKVGDKYTKDGFLIDAGIFRTHGYDSYLDSKVKEELTKKGKTEEEIDNVLDFSTRDDKIQFLHDTKAEFDSKKEYDEKELEKELKRIEVEDKAFEKLKQGGVDENVAFANAKLFGQFFKRYGANNPEAFKEWFDKFDVQYNVPNTNTKSVHQFIGKKGAKNYDENILADLEKAKELDKQGRYTEITRRETGWFKGADNLWRYEISDKDAELINENIAYTPTDERYSDYYGKLREFNSRLSELVKQKDEGKLTKELFEEEYNSVMKERSRFVSEADDYHVRRNRNYTKLGRILKHDKLYKAYPELKDLTVELIDGGQTFGGRFTYDAIQIPEDTLKSTELKSVLMHEIQHYIQDKEGFAMGGNPESVMAVIRKVLKDIDNSPEERKRKELVKELDEMYKKLFVIGSAIHVLKIKDRPESMFKTWWWSKHGSWWIPRKSAKKQYKPFMEEWTEKFLKGVRKEVEEKGEEAQYNEYLEMDLNELNRLYRNLDAKKNRVWKKLPKDIARNFRKAVSEYEKKTTAYGQKELTTELYKRLAGETEARNTQKRMDMTDEERKDDSPRFTQDYEEENQIVVFSDGSTVSYKPNASATEEEVKTYFQSAYHGTPHEVENLSTKYIGTGEGAQGHGWGIYVAKDILTGWEYRNRLNRNQGNDEAKVNGVELSEIYDNLERQSIRIRDNKQAQEVYNKMALIEELMLNKSPEEIVETFSGDDYGNMEQALEWFKKDVVPNLKYSGTLLEVNIPEEEEMLDEEKSFSEQPKQVQDALKKIVADGKKNNEFDELEDAIKKDFSGKGIYSSLSYDLFQDRKEASLKLNKYGIKGIKYDGDVDGICYVIFDEKNVETIKTFYQDSNEEEEKLIAGYTYPEVLEKMTDLYGQLDSEGLSEKEQQEIMAKVHVLEDAFEVAENPQKFSNEDRQAEIMLNAYYIMNNQEIPEDYLEAEAISKRTYDDLRKLHIEKKEKAEAEYYGYFTEGQNKNVITIMANHNSSTALHELGHLFLNGLNELARADENARQQLEAVNKWLGFSGEYTVAQQEKFARSFEAYLYKGKAPNNSLRQVFENFKEWLKSVYEHITDIENKGADISPEVQELFDNIFNGDEYYNQRKLANELLRRVKTIVKKEKVASVPVRDDKELDEIAKRHKEVSYEILSVGTGKSVKYLKTIFETGSNRKSFGKKRESVEELLDKVDDKITASGGMREHWKEFYSDTGVSYDNDEIGGDYELVQQALDVIVNKSYGYQQIENMLDERAQYFEKAIDEADRQYKVLLRSFKKENRNVALSAIYEWLDELNPEIKEDYENRFIYDSGIIERNEHVDKFDKAKRKILARALELDNQFSITSDEKYKELVKEVMKNLDFLQPSDKAKLTANILDVPSTNFLMSSIDNILDVAKTMEDVNYRRNLEREIHKELQKTKNVKKNGRSVGRYDYKTNKIFEELRELDRLSPEQANELRLEMGRFATAEDNGLSFKDKLINKFLSYKSAGRTFADTDLMKELYDEILKIKLVGKSAKSELDLQEKLDESKDINELIEIVQKKKDAGKIVKNYIDKVANLESTLNAIFNKDIKERYGAEILFAETQAQAWQHQQKSMFESEVARIYNLPSWCWDKKILEYLGEKHVFQEFRRKYDTNGDLLKVRTIDRTLTKMDIIQAYIWSKNEVLEKRLINQFGEETLEAMFDELSLEDVKFAELMMRTAQSFYNLVNKAFINKYGLDLPKVSCYFPSTPERGSEVDLYNDYSSKSMNNSFTKARAQSETQAMDFHNPVATLYNHIEGVAKFAFMSDSLDKANLRFRDLDLKRVIINKYGEDAYRTLEQALMNVTYKKEAPVFNGMNKIIDNMVGNWIQANVAVKPIVGLKQLLSANNYAVDMPYMTWQAGFLKALANPKETIDYMMNIPYIKARFQGNFSNEFLKQTIENSAFAMSKKLKDACTLFIKIGDIGAIMFGGKPYIDYLIKEKGMSEEQAIKQFILSTNRSQQSSAVSSLSNFQVNMTRNPMGKLFIAFKNSPQQYIRMCGDAIVSVANGDMSKKQCAKMLFQYGYLQPFFYAVATSGSLLRFLFTGDDDDLLKDASVSVFNLGSDALPIIGDIYKYAINKMLYKEKFLPQTTPLLGDIQHEINKMSKEDADLADYLEAIGYMGLHVGLGYNSKAFTSIGSGVGDIFNGDVAKGSMKVLGYTENRAKNITEK